MAAVPGHRNVKGPFPESYGCVGVKNDGGGSMAGQGLVGPMRLHRAVNRRDMAALEAAIDAGDNVNEVEGVRAQHATRCSHSDCACCASPPKNGARRGCERCYLPAHAGRQHGAA